VFLAFLSLEEVANACAFRKIGAGLAPGIRLLAPDAGLTLCTLTSTHGTTAACIRWNLHACTASPPACLLVPHACLVLPAFLPVQFFACIICIKRAPFHRIDAHGKEEASDYQAKLLHGRHYSRGFGSVEMEIPVDRYCV